MLPSVFMDVLILLSLFVCFFCVVWLLRWLSYHYQAALFVHTGPTGWVPSWSTLARIDFSHHAALLCVHLSLVPVRIVCFVYMQESVYSCAHGCRGLLNLLQLNDVWMGVQKKRSQRRHGTFKRTIIVLWQSVWCSAAFSERSEGGTPSCHHLNLWPLHSSPAQCQ